MKILVCFRQDIRSERPVYCYARSVVNELLLKKHKVTTCGEGHQVEFLGELKEKDFDFLLEIENGRNSIGTLYFHQPKVNWQIPTALWAIDVHGNPGIHQHIAPHYKYIFFAPWIKRDVYVGHKNAHWLPNATDLAFFGRENFLKVPASFDFGFHSSKLGLARADKLVEICQKRKWSYDVRQVSKSGRHKWPFMGEAMSACNNLYNRGQRGDSPNQRVFESMAVCRPLLTDLCPDDGMTKLFEDGKHFIGYKRDFSDLEQMMEWVLMNPIDAKEIALNAWNEVTEKHTIKNRVETILAIIS